MNNCAYRRTVAYRTWANTVERQRIESYLHRTADALIDIQHSSQRFPAGRAAPLVFGPDFFASAGCFTLAFCSLACGHHRLLSTREAMADTTTGMQW